MTGMNTTMNTTWAKHLPEDRKADFLKTVASSTVALRRLKEILREFDDEVTRAEVSTTDYNTPSWAYRQAHRNGQRQAYKQLKDLLSFLKD
jgi:hypothetical protein